MEIGNGSFYEVSVKDVFLELNILPRYKNKQHGALIHVYCINQLPLL